MTSLRTDLDHYLQLRRRLGHELADAARLLPRYLDYLEQSGQTTITVANATNVAVLTAGTLIDGVNAISNTVTSGSLYPTAAPGQRYCWGPWAGASPGERFAVSAVAS